MTPDTQARVKSIVEHVVSFATLVVIVILMVVQQQGGSMVRTMDEVTTSTVIMVLGAGLESNGEPSDALMDRLETGAELYQRKLAPKVLLTGDGGEFRINEVVAMEKAMKGLGVPSEDILIDTRGFRTYESCKRAAEVYKFYDAIVVTQRFHLGRANYLCAHLGMHRVQGVEADKQSYKRIWYFWTRDLVSSVKAWWDVHVLAPKPPV